MYAYLYAMQVAIKFLSQYTLYNFPIVPDVSRAIIPLSHRRARTKLEWQTLQHLLDVLRGLATLDLCSERTWTATSLAQHGKGRSLRDCRSELPPSPASLAVDQHQEQKERVFSHFWTSETPSHCASVFAVRTIE